MHSSIQFRTKIDGFDTELAHRAEIFSDKWVQLFKKSTHNDDNIAQIIKTITIGEHSVNRFNVQGSIVQHSNSLQDSIIDQNKLILLDKKYFTFDAFTSSDSPALVTSDSNDDERTNIEKYTTVFDHSDDQVENNSDSNALPTVEVNEKEEPPMVDHKSQRNTQIKTNKKKKGRTKYRPLTYEEVTTSTTSNARGNILAAPPGVKVLKSSITNQHNMDLSKNGNYSLQFRL